MSTGQEEAILPNPPPPRPIAHSEQKARARAATAVTAPVTAPVEGVGRSGDEALEARASALPESSPGEWLARGPKRRRSAGGRDRGVNDGSGVWAPHLAGHPIVLWIPEGDPEQKAAFRDTHCLDLYWI
jgi:hypothetical protein